MGGKYVFVISLLYTIGRIYCGYDYTCDYTFGDPSWNYSTIFHNKAHVIPAHVNAYEIFFAETKLMISFVCVNVTTINNNHPRVAFASLFKRLTIEFDVPNEVAVVANVLAMHHGYRRNDRDV